MNLVHLMQTAISTEPDTVSSNPLSSEELRKINAYWRAANYLSIGQIYLHANPLLTEPLRLEHIKPRLLGHWSATSGLNFIYAHCNRLIEEQMLRNRLIEHKLYISRYGDDMPQTFIVTVTHGRPSKGMPNWSGIISNDAFRKIFSFLSSVQEPGS